MKLYNQTATQISTLITKKYSTSFFWATSMLRDEMQDAITSIYGFVRLADEIVDTFHDYDKEFLLNKFEQDYFESYDQGISLNPILHSFQFTVRKYNIPNEYVQSFLNSMRADLKMKDYTNQTEIDEYIYGSADVVGLMCLKVFCHGDDAYFIELKKPAMKLGSAFQKVNFLRDLKTDMETLDRSYFPEIEKDNFNETIKEQVILQINHDFEEAFEGIKRLPTDAKLSVLLAYYYYKNLLQKIERTPAGKIMEERIRIPDAKKIALLLKAILVIKFKLI
jgi:15-cis-phytoene synthase